MFKRCYDPRLRLKVEKLDEDRRYEFEERAAILQHEGGMSRALAELEAWRQISEEIEIDKVGILP